VCVCVCVCIYVCLPLRRCRSRTAAPSTWQTCWSAACSTAESEGGPVTALLCGGVGPVHACIPVHKPRRADICDYPVPPSALQLLHRAAPAGQPPRLPTRTCMHEGAWGSQHACPCVHPCGHKQEQRCSSSSRCAYRAGGRFMGRRVHSKAHRRPR